MTEEAQSAEAASLWLVSLFVEVGVCGPHDGDGERRFGCS